MTPQPMQPAVARTLFAGALLPWLLGLAALALALSEPPLVLRGRDIFIQPHAFDAAVLVVAAARFAFITAAIAGTVVLLYGHFRTMAAPLAMSCMFLICTLVLAYRVA